MLVCEYGDEQVTDGSMWNGLRVMRYLVLALFLLAACDSPSANGGNGGVGGVSGTAGSGGTAATSGTASAGGTPSTHPVTRISPSNFVVQFPADTSGGGATTGGSGTSGNPGSAGSGGSPIAQCIPAYPTGSPPTEAVCGDGFRAVDEACDDGNALAGDACSPTCQITPQLVSPRVPPHGTVTRINSGGEMVGSFGEDRFGTPGWGTYSSGNVVSTSGVANAAPAEVYQSERYGGDFSYTLSGLSPAVAYTVRLHFAEIWFDGVGSRVFDVAINGTRVLENFDIYSIAGPNQAVVREFSPVANGEGEIIVSLTGVIDNAKLSGLELIPQTSQVPSVAGPIRLVNSGGDAVGLFSADESVDGGSTYWVDTPITTSGVANAARAEVYQSERWGDFTYTLGGFTPAEIYTVRLHFAEIYWTFAGARVFNTAINGTEVLTNFDIFSVAGANAAVVREFSAVANSQGQIVISFSPVVDNATVSGIEVLKTVVHDHPSLPGRTIGAGRHPLSAGCNAVAVAFSELSDDSPALYLSTFKSAGQPLGSVQVAQLQVSAPDPSVAALPGDDFVVSWTDFDDDELGISLRKVVGGLAQGQTVVANEDAAFSQSGSDIVFDGSELVVAWVDSHDATTGPDLRYRLFTPDLKPLTGDQTLAATGAVEDGVVLAGRGGHWAAAWRAGSQGMETIEVQSGSSHWTVGPFAPGAAEDRPDLTFLDETHLAVAFTMGTDPRSTGQANVPRLHAAVLDPATPGLTESFALAPAQEPYASLPSVGQSEPNLVLAADHLLVAWRSGALPGGNSKGAELWSRRVPFSVSGNSVTLDPSHIEVPIVQQPALRDGDQDAFRMVGTTLWPSGGLVSVWDDSSRSFGSISAGTDVVLQSLPDFAEAPSPDPQEVPFELSADGHYYNVNVLRRAPRFPEPTATVTYAGGAWQYIRPPSAAFDGDDAGAAFGGGDSANPWAQNLNASSTIVIDMGRVLSIGAIRTIYNISLRAPNLLQLRVAETSGQWVTVIPQYLTDRTTVVNPLMPTHEFPAIRARYLELTQTGTSSFGQVALEELLVFPSAAQDPPPSTLDGYDITYLSRVTHSQNANMLAYYGPRTLFDKNFFTHLGGKTLEQGANGDAIVTIDLGGWFSISQVTMTYYYGYHWQLGGRIEVAADDGVWNIVADSGRGNPLGTSEGPQTFTFTRQTARYVRLTSYFVPGVGLNAAGWNIPAMHEVQVF